jgi:hypothetical protein
VKAKVRLYGEIGYDYGEPLWECDIQVVRIQSANSGSRGIERLIVGETLVDDQGRPVRDYDHDTCWAFRMEMVVTSKTIIFESWMEVTGVVSEFTDYDSADDIEECTSCDIPHPIRERYTSRKKRPDLAKTWAVITILEASGD